MRWITGVTICFIGLLSCRQHSNEKLDDEVAGDHIAMPPDSLVQESSVTKIDTAHLLVNKVIIRTGDVQPQQVIDFAKTLIGTRYQYGSTDPAVGFDCSGFITYVFKHFNIQVPRSSIDFTEVGRTVDLDSVKPGDIILFSGTDSTEQHVGHMGIITANQNGAVEFIHSTSGKQYGVTITPLSRYYLGRFRRVARIFSQNER
jgi:cell wall-associated NlpC family hydrolase